MADENQPVVDLGEFMARAWAGFMAYAIRDARLVAVFEKETGIALPSKVVAGEVAIQDKLPAHGAELEADIERFVIWTTERLWGAEYAPKAIRDKVSAREAARGEPACR